MENVITPSNEEQCCAVLNDVFDNFDFEKVKKTMDALEWEWGGLKRLEPKQNFREVTGCFVPTLDEIKETAARLMWDCANNDVDCLSNGGFRVEKDFTDPDDPWMRLTFEVTEYNASYSDYSETDKEKEEEEDEEVAFFKYTPHNGWEMVTV